MLFKPWLNRYEKLRPSKPRRPTTKTHKTTHVQLLCNYRLGITTIPLEIHCINI